MPEFYTLGYGRWAAGIRWARFVATLRNAKVTTLVDIRHSPCPSQLDPDNSYGPRDWHLLGAGRGMVPLLREEASPTCGRSSWVTRRSRTRP